MANSDAISVHFGGGPYTFNLRLWKSLKDPRTGASGSTETFHAVRTGGFEAFRMLLDYFLDEYLRVNECGP